MYQTANFDTTEPTILVYNHLPYQSEYDIPGFKVIVKKNQYELNSILNSVLVSCVIIHFNDIIRKDLLLIKQKFADIPFLALIDSEIMEAAWFCGSIGINKVLNSQEVSGIDLSIEVEKLIKCNNVSISIKDLDMNLSGLHSSVREALAFIEKNYVNLKTVSEISSYLGITDSTLIREFQKSEISSPKQILIFFKILHSIKLMKLTRLKIKEIAHLSGFTCVKRFNESFQRIYSCSPTQYDSN
ncbi:hypothetical protein TH53_23690 [Pedobacter lusitanus]|uniref:HTH araC/xylS-type domain-containing protein n=1 Tax=Pedobacter lusitanus TaxID=1503925 RepID=A0A0D0GFI0_9SPHI|nr:AraC family transcriptional regulator [Pedobacter lusitanus]KIO74890.1 hypothetical protein TH53_23690 [Pedobacter lusitanus]